MTDEKTEEWRAAVGFAGYEVSDVGRVRSVDRIVSRTYRDGRIVRQPRRGKILAATPDERGYPRVKIGDRDPRVHILVLEAFVGPRPLGLDALHGDGNSANPSAVNLRWGTSSENRIDAIRHGVAFLPKGEQHGAAKLTNYQVRDIKLAISRGARGVDLAERYGTTSNVISDIKTGRTWKSVSLSELKGPGTAPAPRAAPTTEPEETV